MVVSSVPERTCVQGASPTKICKLKKKNQNVEANHPLFLLLPVFGENKLHLLVIKMFLIGSD